MSANLKKFSKCRNCSLTFKPNNNQCVWAHQKLMSSKGQSEELEMDIA